MTYRFYRIFPAVLLALFIPVFALNEYSGRIPWLTDQPSLAFAIWAAKPVLSLCFPYFGIYACMCKIRPKGKHEGPIFWIVFGCLFTLLSFGSPIIEYTISLKFETPALSQDRLRELTVAALDGNKTAANRVAAARLYYWETGRIITYLDSEERYQTYTPGKKDDKYFENLNFIEKSKRFIKMAALGHMGLLLVSGAAFALFVRYKKKTHTMCESITVDR